MAQAEPPSDATLQDARGGAVDDGQPQAISPQTAASQVEITFPISFRTPAKAALPLLSLLAIYVAFAALRTFRTRSIFETSLAEPIFLSVILSAYVVLMMARFPLSVTVLKDAIEVQYTLWRRRVPYRAITNITLNHGRDLKGKRVERVRIDLSNFITFSVTNLRQGSLTLYDAIRAGWNPVHAVPQTVAAATSEPLTKLSIPYEPDWRRDPSLRRFPRWLVPAMLALTAVFVLVAPRGVWRDLLRSIDSAPDTKALATFPEVKTGWTGAPVPIFPGETLGGRWNVDYKTGAFTHSQTDFYIGDSIPINVTRVFLNRASAGAFGAGTGISYDIHPVGDSVRFTYMFIVAPDGENFRFTRTSPGTSWADAVYRAVDIRGPGANPFAGATISWNGSGWTLRMLDGTLMKFPAAHGQASEGQEGLLSIEDGKGNLLRIDRDRRGNILKITSPHGAYVTFKHDSDNRIVSATDYLGKTILYDYDANEQNQHLIRVDDPRDGITHYAYGQTGTLVSIVKPDGTAWLKANYDDHGRLAEMVFEDGHSCHYKYQTDAQGMIAGVDVIPSNRAPSCVVTRATGR